MFDPCGTEKLEGEEILKRLAKHLGVDAKDLKEGLRSSVINRCANCGNGSTSHSH